MRIAMLGAGYVGLVSGACFAEFGVDVCLVDTDAAKVAGLREGRIPIYEPGLDRLVEEGDTVVAIGSGRSTHRNGDVNRFAYCDVFTFTGELVSRVESYLVPLGGPPAEG